MSEDITLFNAGDKVTAEETNKNNQLLKGWALDDKATQSWVTSQLSSLSSTLTSQINSVSNGAVKTTGNQSIAGNKTFSGTVKIPNSAAAGTAVSTAAISKSASGYVKLGNGIIIQWMNVGKAASDGIVTKTWATAFSNTNYVISRNINYNTTSTSSVPDREFAVYKKSASQFSYYAYDTYSEMFMAIGY